MYDIHRGDVFYIDREETVGCEQRSGRPAIVVSTDTLNLALKTVEIVYLTTQPKREAVTHVPILSTGLPSTALCEQVTTVDTTRLCGYKCSCSEEEMAAIDEAIRFSLSLGDSKSTSDGASMEAQHYIKQINYLKAQLAEAKMAAKIYKQFYTDLISVGHHPAELLISQDKEDPGVA